jgi:hypothetical protein
MKYTNTLLALQLSRIILEKQIVGYNQQISCYIIKQIKVFPVVKLKYLEKIFRSKILTLLLSKGKITPEHINLLKSWKHSDFRIVCGPRNRGPVLEGWGLSSKKGEESMGEKRDHGNPGSLYHPGLFL